MAPPSRLPGAGVAEPDRAEPTVRDSLFRQPARFDFFQAVRLLERFYPKRRSIGRQAQLAQEGSGRSVRRHGGLLDEVVRFTAHPSMAFPTSEIDDLAAVKEGKAAVRLSMSVNFMGLYGPEGTLPHRYTQEIIAAAQHAGQNADDDEPRLLNRRRIKSHPLRAFLDIFNHRMIALFFRAWEKYRFPIAFERVRFEQRRRTSDVRDPASEDHFSRYVRSFIGVGTAGLRRRFGIPDETLLYYGGLLAKRPRSAVALETVLEDHFGVPVEVRQFQGDFFQIEAESRTQLGGPGPHQLGIDAGLWSHYWDPQVRFRVRLGPLSYPQFNAFLPKGEAHRGLVQFTRFFVGEEFSFDVQLVLRKDEVPPCQLGGSEGASLGWAAWIAPGALTGDVDNVVLAGRAATMESR